MWCSVAGNLTGTIVGLIGKIEHGEPIPFQENSLFKLYDTIRIAHNEAGNLMRELTANTRQLPTWASLEFSYAANSRCCGPVFLELTQAQYCLLRKIKCEVETARRAPQVKYPQFKRLAA
jgi:hypothetical protein